MEEERIDRRKRNVCFSGQDSPCESLVTVLEELDRPCERAENTSCGWVGKFKAAGGLLLVEGKAVCGRTLG